MGERTLAEQSVALSTVAHCYVKAHSEEASTVDQLSSRGPSVEVQAKDDPLSRVSSLGCSSTAEQHCIRSLCEGIVLSEDCRQTPGHEIPASLLRSETHQGSEETRLGLRARHNKLQAAMDCITDFGKATREEHCKTASAISVVTSVMATKRNPQENIVTHKSSLQDIPDFPDFARPTSDCGGCTLPLRSRHQPIRIASVHHTSTTRNFQSCSKLDGAKVAEMHQDTTQVGGSLSLRPPPRLICRPPPHCREILVPVQATSRMAQLTPCSQREGMFFPR